MNNLKQMQKCACVNFESWLIAPKVWAVLSVMAVFGVWNIGGILNCSVTQGIRITPWVFPHYFAMPAMKLVYGFLTAALFSDAPFKNPLSQFLEIRAGKRIWLLGQCLFILEASFVYSILYFLITVLLLLPRMYVSGQWGKLLETIACNHISLAGISVSDRFLELYPPVPTTLLTIFFVWLVSCFLGMLILMGRIAIGRNAGLVMAGFFVFLSYFSAFVGSLIFGSRIYLLSPVSWVYLGTLPDKLYAVSFLTAGILLFMITGLTIYELNDMEEMK